MALNFAYNSSAATLTVNRELELDLAQALTNADNPTLSLRNQSFTISHVATGDLDGINLPWFNKADACLLYFELHGDEREVSLEVQRHHDSPAHQVSFSIVSSTRGTHSAAHAADHWSNSKGLPLLTIGFDWSNSSENTFLEQYPSFTFPSSFSTSPSLTYPIRRAIQIVLSRAFYLASASATVAWIVFRLVACIGLFVTLVWLWRHYRAGRETQEADLERGHGISTAVVAVPSSKEEK